MLKSMFICWLILSCFLAIPAFAKEEGLVLYMKFDDLDGNEVRDHSGMGNHGMAFGNYELVDGKLGKGLRMDGSTSNYVEVLDADTLDVTEVYSMLVWVNFAEITGERHQFFFDKGADDKNPGGWRLGKVMSGDLKFQVFKDGAWQPGNDLMKPNFETDKWYHAAVTRDKNGTTKIYLDGKAGVSVDIEGYVLPINENSLMIWGSTVWGTNNMFTGTIDELAIFKDRALTEAEINSFMRSGQTAVEQNNRLAGRWGEIKVSK